MESFENHLTTFYEEKPVLIDWVKAVKELNTWDLAIRVKFKTADTESIYVDALRKMYMTLTPASILEALGYRIKWHGIDPQSAKVRKR